MCRKDLFYIINTSKNPLKIAWYDNALDLRAWEKFFISIIWTNRLGHKEAMDPF